MSFVDRGLCIEALDEAVLRLLNSALGISEVPLRLRRRGSVLLARHLVRRQWCRAVWRRIAIVLLRGLLRFLRRLRLCLERSLGFTNLCQSRLRPAAFGRQLVTSLPLPLALVLGSVGLFSRSKQLCDLLRQLAFLLKHPLVAHRLVLARVRLELRSIQCHVAKSHEPSLHADCEHLLEKPGESLQVNPA